MPLRARDGRARRAHQASGPEIQNTKYKIQNAAGLWGGRLLLFGTLDSTNRWALEHASECRHGDVIRAVHQTAGRGRFDREWVSPAGTCLTLSVVVSSGLLNQDLPPRLTRIAALAVCRTLERHGVTAQVKWPNDVLVDRRKVCGILAEQEGKNGAIVVGIGLNVNLDPAAIAGGTLRTPATSMRKAVGRTHDINGVCRTLLTELQALIDRTDRGDTAFFDLEWFARDALTGRKISVSTGEIIVNGAYLGTTGDGALRLLDDQSVERIYAAGDVTILPA